MEKVTSAGRGMVPGAVAIALIACLGSLAPAARVEPRAGTGAGVGAAARPPASSVSPEATRIVSTSPSATETLFALGLGSRVVGVSRFCRYPAEAEALPKIGTFLRPDVELIARLQPDLVVIHASHSGIEQRLTTVAIPFISVERATLASVYAMIRDIGAAAGVPDRANALVHDVDRQLDEVRQAVAGRRPQRVLIVVGRRAGTLTDLVSAGRATYLHDLVAIAGGVNVLDDPSLPAYPRISLETVIRLAPDVIVDTAEMGDRVEDMRARQQRTEALWQTNRLIAASKARVHSATSEAFVTPGPRVTEVARLLARWLHGVEAR